jgi:peroxiredoxin
MKRVLTVVLFSILLLTLAMNGFSTEKEWLDKAKQLRKEKKDEQALQVIDEGLKELGESEKLTSLKYFILLDLERYDDAMTLVDEAIKKDGETDDLLESKVYVFYKQKKFQQALEVMLKREAAKELSAWGCIDTMEIYLNLENSEKAWEWLNKAVDRGFINYSALYEDEYKGLPKDARFEEILQKIKTTVGVGKPAKDFTLELLNGEKFTLSAQKGKVVLVDFWATWCGPCRREIPNLKQYYTEFQNKNFEIIGISLDTKKESLDDYIAKEKLPWKITASLQGWKDETAKFYGVKSIPSYWLIDKKGLLRHFGLRQEKLKEAIAQLVAEK